MNIDFSSTGAWKFALRWLRFVCIGMLLIMPVAMIANGLEHRPLLPDSRLLIWLPMLVLLFWSPFLLWWAILRVSELSIAISKPANSALPGDGEWLFVRVGVSILFWLSGLWVWVSMWPDIALLWPAIFWLLSLGAMASLAAKGGAATTNSDLLRFYFSTKHDAASPEGAIWRIAGLMTLSAIVWAAVSSFLFDFGRTLMGLEITLAAAGLFYLWAGIHTFRRLFRRFAARRE